MLKSKKEREWDQNNQQVGAEELICAAKPEPSYCSGTGTAGVYISKESLNHQAHYLSSNEYIILYSKWNRYNRRKTHLSKARHSSWTNPCVTHQAEEACQSDFPTPYISIFMMNVSLFLSCYVFLSSKLVKDIYQCAAEVKDTSKKVGDIPFHIQPSACHQCYAVKGRNN